MSQPKIYLDTTIPSYLFAPERPDREEATWRLWDRCRRGEYEIFVSDVFFEELDDCREPKLSKLYEQLNQIVFTRLKESQEADGLAMKYIEYGGFAPKSKNDSLHVAYASVYGCDYVLSWNFHHTRAWTRNKIKEVNERLRYDSIEILQPDAFLRRGC